MARGPDTAPSAIGLLHQDVAEQRLVVPRRVPPSQSLSPQANCCVGDGEADGLGVAVAVGMAVGAAVAVGDVAPVAVAGADELAVGDDPVGVGVGVGGGEGVGAGVGAAQVIVPLTSSPVGPALPSVTVASRSK